MVRFNYTVNDPHGIHARPAGLLVKAAKMFNSDIKIKCGEREADAKKLLAVMRMGVRNGEGLDFLISGEDEELASEEIQSFCRKYL